MSAADCTQDEREAVLITAWRKLNEYGKQTALERMGELTRLPQYTKRNVIAFFRSGDTPRSRHL